MRVSFSLWIQAYVLEEQGRLLELVDPKLGSNYSKEEALQMLNLCLVCTYPSPTLRPTMSTVVSILEGKSAAQVQYVKPAVSKGEDSRFKLFGKLYYDSETHSTSTFSQSIKEEDSMRSSSSNVLLNHTDSTT